MTADDANSQRVEILRLAADGLGGDAIARQLGCPRSTVFQVLRAPGPDRRTAAGRRAANRTPEPIVLEIRRLALDDVGRGPEEIAQILRARRQARGAEARGPALRTIRRIADTARAEARRAGLEPVTPRAQPAPDDPDIYLDLDVPGYAASLAASQGTLRNETTVLRAFIRQTLQEMSKEEGSQSIDMRVRLREKGANLIGLLNRVVRPEPAAGTGSSSELLEMLARINQEISP